jgi:hypothetical protein
MLTNYTLTNDKDVYTLTNDGIVDLSYDLLVSDGCDNYTNILSAILAPAASVEIDLTSRIDSVYQLNLDDGVDQATETIKKYSQLLASAILATENYLCNCGCRTCDDCDPYEESEAGLNTLVKLVYYYSLYKPDYDTIVNYVFGQTKCLISDEAHCMLANEALHGISSNTELNKKLVSLYYLAYYFYEYDAANGDTALIAEADAKFKTSIIFSCITKLGIDINDIRTNLP